MVASTSSVYLLSAVKPLSGTMFEKSVSPAASSDSGAGGAGLTMAAAPSSGRSSYAGTRTMYTTSFSRECFCRSRSMASFRLISAVISPTLTPLALRTARAGGELARARVRRAIFGPTPSSSSASAAAAAASASARCSAAIAPTCTRQEASMCSESGDAASAASASA